MKCLYNYNCTRFGSGSLWCFDEIYNAIIGKEIHITTNRNSRFQIGTALINNFKYILDGDACEIDFKIISFDEQYLYIPFYVRGPKVNRYFNIIQLIITIEIPAP